MANYPSAKKRIRQTEKRTPHNTAMRSRMRTQVKGFDKAVEGGDRAAIGAAFTLAMSALHRAVSKGIIKKGTAARKISRMAARINSQSTKA